MKDAALSQDRIGGRAARRADIRARPVAAAARGKPGVAGDERQLDRPAARDGPKRPAPWAEAGRATAGVKAASDHGGFGRTG
jgi:hypothetical protein